MNSDLVHMSCVAVDEKGVLIAGRSGSGKSDLALRLIDRGAVLVSDDICVLRVKDGRLCAAAPARLEGKIEVRGLGIVETSGAGEIAVSLIADLDENPQRMPESETRTLLGVAIPLIRLSAIEASAPIKIEWALR